MLHLLFAAVTCTGQHCDAETRVDVLIVSRDLQLYTTQRSTHNMREMKSEHGTGDKKRTWNQKNYTVLFITFMSSNAVYIIYMWHTIVIQRYPCITVLMGLHYQLTTSNPCTVCTARTKRGLFIVQFHVCVWHLSLALTGCTKACKHSSNMW